MLTSQNLHVHLHCSLHNPHIHLLIQVIYTSHHHHALTGQAARGAKKNLIIKLHPHHHHHHHHHLQHPHHLPGTTCLVLKFSTLETQEHTRKALNFLFAHGLNSTVCYQVKYLFTGAEFFAFLDHSSSAEQRQTPYQEATFWLVFLGNCHVSDHTFLATGLDATQGVEQKNERYHF